MRLVKQLAAVVLVALVGSRAMSAADDATDGNGVVALVLGVATSVLAVLAYRWVVRRTEARSVDELALGRGARGPVRGVGRGLAVGAGMFAVVIASLALSGAYRVDGWGSVGGAVGLLAVALAAGVTEELMFRGVLFRIVEERFGTWVALVATAVLFGGMHLGNPHATVWGALAIALEAGGMLAAAYVATRSLWLPIGIHVGWNAAQGALFGTEVSGSGASDGLLHGVTSGPAFLSGGGFGPEASVPAVLVGAAVTTILLVVARRRGHIVPRRSSDAAAAQPDATVTV